MEGIVLTLRTADGRTVAPRERFRPRHATGHGRLASPLDGVGEDHVRCSCEDCGAHLLGTLDGHGHASGVCLVCGSVAVRPL